jgi:hypothetical protein
MRFALPLPGRDQVRDDRAGSPGHSLGHRVLPLLPDGRPEIQGGDGPQAAHPMFTMPLGEVENARVLRYREKTTQLSFEVVWSPGKNHEIADALSRAPVFDPPEEEEVGHICAIQAEDPILQDLYDAAEEDAEYQKVKEAWENGREPRNLPFGHPARLFNNVWDGLG